MQFWFITVLRKYLNFDIFSTELLVIIKLWFHPAFWWRHINMYLVFSYPCIHHFVFFSTQYITCAPKISSRFFAQATDCLTEALHLRIHCFVIRITYKHTKINFLFSAIWLVHLNPMPLRRLCMLSYLLFRLLRRRFHSSCNCNVWQRCRTYFITFSLSHSSYGYMNNRGKN